MVTKKGSKEHRVKMSRLQKASWKKRKAEKAMLQHTGTTKATMQGPKSNAQNVPKNETAAAGFGLPPTADGKPLYSTMHPFNPDSLFVNPPLHDSPINPAHYQRHPSGVECIVITEHFNFNRGNAIKYIWRADEKGSTLENLRKAQWYLNREISRLEKEAIK